MEEQAAPSGEAPKPAPKGKGLWIGIAVVVVVVVVLLALVLGGFFNPPPGPTEDEILKIGTALPLTGGLSAYGPGMERAARLAVEEINANGGGGGGRRGPFTAGRRPG